MRRAATGEGGHSPQTACAASHLRNTMRLRAAVVCIDSARHICSPWPPLAGPVRPVRIGRPCNSCGEPRKFLDDPVLEVFRDDPFGLDAFVIRSDQEERCVLAHLRVVVLGDNEVIAARAVAALAEDPHPGRLDGAHHLVDAAKDSLVLTDPTFALVQH
jgi:hypothetical protein